MRNKLTLFVSHITLEVFFSQSVTVLLQDHTQNTHTKRGKKKGELRINVMARNKDTRPLVGNSGQGMYWQGWWPRHMVPCQGGAPCLYCKEDIVVGKITWGQINPAREQMSPP